MNLEELQIKVSLDLKDLNKQLKGITKSINDSIKEMERIANELSKASVEKDTPRAGSVATNDQKTKYTVGDDTVENMEIGTKKLDKLVQIYKAASNDLTVYFGAKVKALTDRNRQAKAICVKALSYKHEAATLESAYGEYDIFSGVEII